MDNPEFIAMVREQYDKVAHLVGRLVVFDHPLTGQVCLKSEEENVAIFDQGHENLALFLGGMVDNLPRLLTALEEAERERDQFEMERDDLIAEVML